MSVDRLRAEISRTFKLHGYQLRVDAAKRVAQLLAPLQDDPDEVDLWINKMVEVVAKRKDLTSNLVTKEIVEQVVKECSDAECGADDEAIVLNVIDAFDVPRFEYSGERKKFIKKEGKGGQIYADADSKSSLFRDRYTLLHQRTSRHALFTPSLPTEKQGKKFKLKTIEFLHGTNTKLSDVIVLGMISQIQQGKFSLEDPTGAVTLDLSESKFHTGLYTENCFVLAEGWYEDAIFHVTAMGFPPSETSETTREFFGKNINFFGGPLETSCKASAKLKAKLDTELSDAMFVILSDVWLDKANVMEKLRKLMDGFSAMPPTCFILMGNFLSAPYGSQQAKILKEHFRSLSDLICEYPELVESSKFIFIPGPNDPGYTNIFPRPAIPDVLTEELRKKIPNAIFASNPCRIQFCTRELVFFREDMVTKMCRNCIYFPESGSIPGHFSKTLISQAHLAPMPLHICPVYWEFDRSMYLYPVPDLVVIGDKFDPFCAETAGCQVVNPGSFSKNGFCFKTYVPKTNEVEDSQLPDEE